MMRAHACAVCSHPKESHKHYRPGTECVAASCHCGKYRRRLAFWRDKAFDESDALSLLYEAFFLRQNGEYAPGGNENWHAWERQTETFLRSLMHETAKNGQ